MSSNTDRSQLISFGIFILLCIMVGTLQLTTAFVAALFSYLALRMFCIKGNKSVAIGLFVIFLLLVSYGFAFFVNHAIVALPDIATTSVPVIVRWATEHGIELPFTDIGSLKSLVLDSVTKMVGYVGSMAKVATKEFVFLIVGIVVAIGIFLNPYIDYDRSPKPLNLYALYTAQISELFRSFYLSFQAVMGAQVIISGINTSITAIFILSTGLNYAPVVIMLTFLCGLLPVIGNIISNTIIVGIAFTVSPQFAGWALLFLVVIHKLEYFLNSKIIGSRIRQPMWLTLLALILGERLLGISGIILAPVILHFIKTEASKHPVSARSLTEKES
jgi:predicted PurR-regulated permease PerM